MDFPDVPCCVALSDHRGVEILDVFGPQPVDALAAQCREDVVLALGPVVVDRSWSPAPLRQHLLYVTGEYLLDGRAHCPGVTLAFQLPYSTPYGRKGLPLDVAPVWLSTGAWCPRSRTPRSSREGSGSR